MYLNTNSKQRYDYERGEERGDKIGPRIGRGL